MYFCKGKQQLQVGEVGTNWKELYTTGLRVISEWCSTENVKDDSQSHKEWNVELSRLEREGKE